MIKFDFKKWSPVKEDMAIWSEEYPYCDDIVMCAIIYWFSDYKLNKDDPSPHVIFKNKKR